MCPPTKARGRPADRPREKIRKDAAAGGSGSMVRGVHSKRNLLASLTRLRGFALENADFEIFSTAK
jgi:hypothetical protein